MSDAPDQPHPLRPEGEGSSDASRPETTDTEAQVPPTTEPAPPEGNGDAGSAVEPGPDTTGEGLESGADTVADESSVETGGESSVETGGDESSVETDAEEALNGDTDADADAAQDDAAGADDTGGESDEGEAASDEHDTGKKRKRKGKSKARKAGAQAPSTSDVRARIGTTTEAALAYVDHPDPQLSRLPRPVREQLIADLPAVTAGALLGPAALARHLVASAASGRYRDLFALWTLFSRHPDACKPQLADRGNALERARRNLRLATELGLLGRSDRVAEDVAAAEGLIWQWLREILTAHPKAVAERPAVAAALLTREPDFELPLPDHPSSRWLSEAAAVKERGTLPDPLERTLAANVHRLPATIATLRLAAIHYPDRVESLVDAVDLDAPDVEAFLAWARDHGAAERLVGRIRDHINAAASRDRVEGLARWDAWRRRGVDLPVPTSVAEAGLEGLDLTRPETSQLAAVLEQQGHEINMQQRLEELAGRNRQLAEKAYEAAVCAGLDVALPDALAHNPIVKEGTRCPRCQAWTWVRPGHEERCPRGEPDDGSTAEPSPGEAFELAAAKTSDGS